MLSQNALNYITQYLQNTILDSSLIIPVLSATSPSLRRAVEDTFEKL